MEEVTLLDFNSTRGERHKLVAIYPEEGTFDSDSPFFTLNAPWVSAAQKDGAAAFQKYLADKITPELAAEVRLPALGLARRPAPPITVANGADPKQPARVLGRPSRACWRRSRTPGAAIASPPTSCSCSTPRAR